MAENLISLGARTRRDVLGDTIDDTLNARVNAFTEPFFDMAQAFCWGSVWARDGLDRRTRSLLNIAMMVALNRPGELENHLNGAVRNGCTAEEIREVLLQATAYVGIPAGGEGFVIAQRVLAAHGLLPEA